MLRIELSITDTGADDSEYVRSVLAPAMRDGVNDVAERAAEAANLATEQLFDRPNPFTRRSFAVMKAQLGNDPSALVYVREIQAEYLELQIEGGIRRAGDYATSRLGPIVPGPHGARDAFGNLPRGYIRKQMQDPHVAWVNLRPDQPPMLIRREPGKQMEVLAIIVREIDYAPRFDFYGIVESAIQKEWPRSAARTIEKALTVDEDQPA